jgi:hypothetical protein
MRANVDAQLTPDEIASLREVSKVSLQRAIPLGNRQRLILSGFIHETSGALMLAEMGRVRVAMGR